MNQISEAGASSSGEAPEPAHRPPSPFAMRRAEIDAAAAADAEEARQARAAEADRVLTEAEGTSSRAIFLAALAVVVLLLGSLWVVHRLYEEGQMEDCLMAHRTNCGAVIIDHAAR